MNKKKTGNWTEEWESNEINEAQNAFFDEDSTNSTDNYFISLDDSDDEDGDTEFDLNIDQSKVNLIMKRR